MADYRTHIDEETGITYIEVSGTIVLDKHMQFVNGDSFGDRTLRVLNDMRKASLGDMSRGKLAKMVRTIRPLSKPGMRAAYVVRKGDDFNKGKSFLAQIEVLGYEGEFRIFTDMKKAVAWVQK